LLIAPVAGCGAPVADLLPHRSTRRSVAYCSDLTGMMKGLILFTGIRRE
jgi:hypothetical protein